MLNPGSTRPTRVRLRFWTRVRRRPTRVRLRCWTRVRFDQPVFACDAEPGFDSTNPRTHHIYIIYHSPSNYLNRLTAFQLVCHLAWSQIDWLHFSVCANSHGVKSIDCISACVPARMESSRLTAFQLVCQLAWSQINWLHFSVCAILHVDVVKSIDYIPACVYIPKVATQNEMSQKRTYHCCVFVTQRNSSAKCQNAMSQKRTICCIFVITKTHNVTKMHNIDILKK